MISYLDAPPTPRELAFGALIAAGLWVLTAALLAGLAVWCLTPFWAA